MQGNIAHIKETTLMEKYFNQFGTKCEIFGSPNFSSLGINLDDVLPDTLTFCGTSEYFYRSLSSRNISTIITNERTYLECRDKINLVKDKAFVIVDDPKEFFFRFHNYLAECTEFYRLKKEETVIGKNPRISSTAVIAPHNVIIGDNVVIEDYVCIKSNVKIGNNVRIQAGVIIGNDCLQCMKVNDIVIDIAHVGGVIIKDNVKIESNSVICRHIFNDNTILGDYAKVGSFVHISHGCKVGRNTILTSMITLGGSSFIGDNVFIGPNVVIRPLIKIGNNSRVTMGSVVIKNLEEGSHVTGNFAVEHKKFMDEYYEGKK